MWKYFVPSIALLALVGCSGSESEISDTAPSWTSPDSAQLLTLYQSAGDRIAVLDGNGSSYGELSMFIDGITISSESEIAALRATAVEPVLVTSAQTDCVEIAEFPLEQFCMLTLSSFEIVPDGMDCVDMECGEAHMELTARLRLINSNEWEIVGNTMSGLLAG